jgi:hypothetical protein
LHLKCFRLGWAVQAIDHAQTQNFVNSANSDAQRIQPAHSRRQRFAGFDLLASAALMVPGDDLSII